MNRAEVSKMFLMSRLLPAARDSAEHRVAADSRDVVPQPDAISFSHAFSVPPVPCGDNREDAFEGDVGTARHFLPLSVRGPTDTRITRSLPAVAQQEPSATVAT